jgi:hypothetical protein
MKMKESHARLLKQFADMAADGQFGNSIKKAQKEYDQLPPGIAILLKFVLDFWEEIFNKNDELAQIRNLTCQLLIIAYREAKKRDTEIAQSLVNSFTTDYPDVPESTLLPRWCSLAQASLAMREVAQSKNRLMVWQQACKQFQAYNEFLNGLLAYLIILWRTKEGRPVRTNVFDTPYANKIDQFSSLTGGEDGVFYLFCRLARPKIRNAIAHETIWLDADENKVRYEEGRHPRTEHEIDFIEFMGLAAAGSHLAQSYLAAIAVIAIMEEEYELGRKVLPSQLVKVFEF